MLKTNKHDTSAEVMRCYWKSFLNESLSCDQVHGTRAKQPVTAAMDDRGLAIFHQQQKSWRVVKDVTSRN